MTRPLNEKVEARILLGEKRLKSVLSRHGVAHQRTLEQKIADAGPFDQRIEPSLLSTAMSRLRDSGQLVSFQDAQSGSKWHHLASTPAHIVGSRLADQRPIYMAVHNQAFAKRLGDALEVAVYRAILHSGYPHWGGFTDLTVSDAGRFQKNEPPVTYCLEVSRSPVDFWALVQNEMLAIEVKNTREWVHTDSEEVRKLLQKATDLNMVPVLIARRIPYVAMRTLEECGVLMHQTYNQRYPVTGADLAAQTAERSLLGYHDVRVGNEPDSRMTKFFEQHLPTLVSRARSKFDLRKGLLANFAYGNISYKQFYTLLQIDLGNWMPRQEVP